MLDIDDLVLEDAAPALPVPLPATPGDATSPLRAWSMWGGWSALGVICAASVARAVSAVGRTVAGR
jgi:hypothetical protein